MEIENWASCLNQSQLYRELTQLDLLENIAELDVFGFTVVPPEKVGPADFHARVKHALVDVVERRFGQIGNDGLTWRDRNQTIRLILWEDPVFEELLLNPAALGLIQHLIGTNCILSLFDGWVKGPGKARTGLHKDHHFDKTRPVMPPEPVGANFNYLVTDYSAADGAVTFVPGTHKWRRAPTPADVAEWTDKAVPIQAPAGSIVLWGDLVWHGSTVRSHLGERLMVRAAYLRPFMQTQEAFRETVTQEALARNPVRFAGLMDVYSSLPFGKQGQDFSRRKQDESVIGVYHSLFDREPAREKVSLRPDYDYCAFDLEAHTPR